MGELVSNEVPLIRLFKALPQLSRQLILFLEVARGVPINVAHVEAVQYVEDVALDEGVGGRRLFSHIFEHFVERLLLVTLVVDEGNDFLLVTLKEVYFIVLGLDDLLQLLQGVELEGPPSQHNLLPREDVESLVVLDTVQLLMRLHNFENPLDSQVHVVLQTHQGKHDISNRLLSVVVEFVIGVRLLDQ